MHPAPTDSLSHSHACLHDLSAVLCLLMLQALQKELLMSSGAGCTAQLTCLLSLRRTRCWQRSWHYRCDHP